MAVKEITAENMFQKGFDDVEDVTPVSAAVEHEKTPESKEGQMETPEPEKEKEKVSEVSVKQGEEVKGVKGDKTEISSDEDYRHKWESSRGIVRSKNAEIERLKEEIARFQTLATKKETESKPIITDADAELEPLKEILGMESVDAVKKLMDKKLSVSRQEFEEKITKMRNEYESQLNPLNDYVLTELNAKHYGSIKNAHSDINKYITKEVDDTGKVIGVGGELLDWIEEQSEGIKDAYLDIFYNKNGRGTTVASIKLIDRFKNERGYDKPPNPKPIVDTSGAKNIMAVKTKRSPVSLETKVKGSGTYEDGWANG